MCRTRPTAMAEVVVKEAVAVAHYHSSQILLGAIVIAAIALETFRDRRKRVAAKSRSPGLDNIVSAMLHSPDNTPSTRQDHSGSSEKVV